MGFSKVNVLILVLLAVSSTLSKTILVAPASEDNVEALSPVVKDSKEIMSKPAELDIEIPGRVHCEYEEATEDKVCQEHCLPKGYSYGLCVSKTCSCI